MAGYAALKDVPFDFIGMLDADIVLPHDYYRRVIDLFEKDPALGMAGGFVYEKEGAVYKSRKYNRRRIRLPGAIQLFRREAFDRIGGIAPLEYGGHDWLAEIHGSHAQELETSIVDSMTVGSPSLAANRHIPRVHCAVLIGRGGWTIPLGSHPVYRTPQVCKANLCGDPFVWEAFSSVCGIRVFLAQGRSTGRLGMKSQNYRARIRSSRG